MSCSPWDAFNQETADCGALSLVWAWRAPMHWLQFEHEIPHTGSSAQLLLPSGRFYLGDFSTFGERGLAGGSKSRRMYILLQSDGDRRLQEMSSCCWCSGHGVPPHLGPKINGAKGHALERLKLWAEEIPSPRKHFFPSDSVEQQLSLTQ